MAGRPLEVIKCGADMVDVWIATLVRRYPFGESSRWMPTVCRKGGTGSWQGSSDKAALSTLTHLYMLLFAFLNIIRLFLAGDMKLYSCTGS